MALADITVDGINYTTDTTNNTAIVTGPSDVSGSIVIPATVNGFNVTSITSAAFTNATSLTTVFIADGQIPGVASPATNVDFFGATGVNLLLPPTPTTFTLNDGSTVEIVIVGELTSSIYSSEAPVADITSVIIGQGVTSIGFFAFSGATSLTAISIPEGVTSIGNAAFQNASSLTSIIIPEGVTSIGAVAFNGASSLTSITIPEGVISIGDVVFMGATSLTSITFGANSQLTSIGNAAFQNASSLTAISIPASVISIGNNAFYEVTSLTSVTFEENSQLTSIGRNAFNATSLTSFIIPASVTYIGDGAFYVASSLTSINIPASVSTIGDYAFYSASSLTSVTFEANSQLTSIGDYVFNSTTALTSVTFAEGSKLTSIGNFAFQNATSLTSIIIPEGVTSMGYNAFYEVTSLTSITFEENSQLTSIGSHAFYDASSLTSINIPASVISIGEAVFLVATSLTSVTFEENSQLTSIGRSAFYGASSLTSITIPASVASIGYEAFGHATSLTSVTFEANSQLTTIGNNAFNGTSLTSVVIADGQIPGVASPATNVSFFGATGVNLFLPVIPEPDPLPADKVAEIVNSVPTVTIPDIVDETTVISVEPPSAGLLTTGTDIEKSQKRTTFLNNLFANNSGLDSTVGKVTIPKEQLLGADSPIQASSVILKKASNSEVAHDTLGLPTGVAMYVYMNINNFAIFSTTAGKLKIEKQSETMYGIWENYVDSNTPITKTMNVGESSSFGKSRYMVGGGGVENVSDTTDSGSGGDGAGSSGPAVPICFPAGTPVMTNKGEVAIEKLNPDVHKIRGKRIVAITETSPTFKYIIRIEKDALGPNIPSRRTEISRDHEVFYKGKMVRSEDLVDKCEAVYRIKYHGETLYNVLMEKHDNMMINNLICETLHPNNIMAKICGGKYTTQEKKKLYNELNNILAKNDISGCKKLYKYLCK